MSSSNPVTRRAMLRASAGTAALAAAGSSLAPLLAAPQSRWFKIGACDWSLGKRSNVAAFDVAKEIGLDGVQIDLGSPANGMHLTKPEVQKAYQDAAKRTGLAFSSLAFCEMNSVPLKSDPRAAQWLSQGLDVAKTLGMKIVMPAMFGAGDLDMKKTGEIDHLVGVIKEIAPKAEKLGILVGLENYLSAEDNMKIIDRVGSPAVRVYYDVGNSTDKGRDILREIRTLGKLICEFHAKDAGFMLGEGRIDFKKVRAAMDDIEFSGWIHIEAATPHGLIVDYSADCRYLKGIFPSKV